MLSLYQNQVLLDKPFLFLPMDDASGQLLDITGNGYHAEVFGSLTRNSQFRTVNGRGGVEVGVRANGHAIVQKPIYPPLNGNRPFTLEFWCANTTTAPAYAAPTDDPRTIISVPADHPGISGWDASLSDHYHYRAGVNNWYYFGHRVAHNQNYHSSLNSSLRDDANITGDGNSSSYSVSPTNGTSATTSLRHVVYKVFNPPVAYANSNASDESGAVYINGSYVQYLGLPLFAWRQSSETFGPGIFIHNNSITGGFWHAEKMWASHLSMYDYALTDAQILKHYQMGIGSYSGNRVAGTTLLDGFPLGGFPVFVHRRDTGDLIGRTVSDNSGAFSCDVGSYAGQVYAVCFDDVSGIQYPAQVFDLIIPSI